MNLKQLLQSITKKEWQLVIIITIVMLLLTGLPYVYAYYNAPEGYFYDGLHFLAPGDFLVYFSYINQIKEGDWQIRDYFTAEPQNKGLLNLFWLGVGLVARIFNLSAFLTFQIFRLLLIPFFLAVLYIFLSYFFQDKLKRKIAFLFACFSSGIGGYFAYYYDRILLSANEGPIYQWPIDLWVPESNIFMSLYHNPHFILSWILMLSFFLLMILAWQNNNYIYSILAGLTGLFWFNFHPYYFPYVFIILFVFGFILFLKTKRFSHLYHYLLALIISLPFVLYHFYKIRTDFVIGARAVQNITLTSPFIFNFLGFGCLFIFSVIGLYYLIKNKELVRSDKYIFLVVWLICSWLLIYAPVAFQRRFLEGMQVPMVILSIVALFSLTEYIKNKSLKLYQFLSDNHYFLILLFAIFFGFSSIFNLVRDVYYFKNNFFIFYLPNEYREAAESLDRHNPQNKVIFSQIFDSWVIPGLVNQHVFLGHMHETIFADIKKEMVDDFFANNYSEDQAKKFLADNNIGFLFFSDIERNFYQYNPLDKNYLEKVWQKGSVEIFQVISEN